MSKTKRDLAKRGVHRMTIDLPAKLWADLQPALKRRVEVASFNTGAECSPTFIAWLRDKAKETIAQYK